MSEDLREDLEAAFSEQPAEEEVAEQPVQQEEPARAARDVSGKFAPRTPAQPAEESAEAVQEPAQAAPAQASPPTQASRAPVSWKPEEREGWERLDERHRQAIIRREREIDNALRSTASERRFSQEVQQAIAPYMPMLQAENATPAQAISSLMKTAAALRTATPVQKAGLVADMVLQFGVGIEDLDQALVARKAGKAPRQDPMANVMKAIEQKLKPLQDFVGNVERTRQQQMQQVQSEAETELDTFLNDPANEFARDVAADMADIMELAANRGQQMSLQDAYRRATLVHPTVSKILESRGVGSGAAQQTAAARKARKAAVSVSGVGAPSVSSDDGGEDDDLRSAITASVRRLATR